MSRIDRLPDTLPNMSRGRDDGHNAQRVRRCAGGCSVDRNGGHSAGHTDRAAIATAAPRSTVLFSELTLAAFASAEATKPIETSANTIPKIRFIFLPPYSKKLSRAPPGF